MVGEDASTAGEGDAEGLPFRLISANQLVAYNMAAFRRAAGLNQADFGKLIGWSNATVSAAERSWDGKRVRQFDADEVVNIAAALGVPVMGLLLLPENADTAVRYFLTTGTDRLITPGLLSILTSADGDAVSTRVRAAFRHRILALGAAGITQLAISTEADRILGNAESSAEELLANARQKSMLMISKAEAEARELREETERARQDAGRSRNDLVWEQAGPAVDQLIADARREADETLGRARREADEMLTKVRRQTEQITSDARARADSLERDAQQRHLQAMGSILQSREELQRRVDDLRSFEREYRSRLLAYLEGQVAELKAGATDSAVFPGLPIGSPPAVGESQ